MTDQIHTEEHANRLIDGERAMSALDARMEPMNALVVGIIVTVLVLLISIAVEVFTAIFVVDVMFPTISGPGNARLQFGANVMTLGYGCAILFVHFLLEWLTESVPKLVDWSVLLFGLAASVYFVAHGTGFSSQVLSGSILAGTGAETGRSFGQSLGSLANVFDAVFPLALSITHLMARRIKHQFGEIVSQMGLRRRSKNLKVALDKYVADHANYHAKAMLHEIDMDESLDIVAGKIAAVIADVAAIHADNLRTDPAKLPAAVRDVPLAERKAILDMLRSYSPQHVRDQLILQGAK